MVQGVPKKKCPPKSKKKSFIHKNLLSGHRIKPSGPQPADMINSNKIDSSMESGTNG